jgi:hypothetical protein
MLVVVVSRLLLTDLLGKRVRIKRNLRLHNYEYEGELASYNLASSHPCRYFHLVNTEEFVHGQLAGFLGEVVVSLDLVFCIRAATDA